MSIAGKNWASLAGKFAFSHNIAVNYSTGVTPYELVFGKKTQIPVSLRLGLLRNNELCCTSEFCTGLPNHAHEVRSSPNESVDRFLKHKPSQQLLTDENDFKQIYSDAYSRSLRINENAHASRNKYKLGKPLDVGQKV